MKVKKTYRFVGLDAFTLVLESDALVGNALTSTIPRTYLRAKIDAHLRQLNYAYIPNLEIAFDWLDRTANIILKLRDAYLYFFKVYLQRNKQINRDVAEYILSNIEDPQLLPMTHYTVNNRPVDFFILNSNALAEWHIYRNSISEISITEFKASLLTNEMKKDFYCLIEEKCKAFVIMRSNKVTFYFLFTLSGRLLMVVNH